MKQICQSTMCQVVENKQAADKLAFGCDHSRCIWDLTLQ